MRERGQIERDVQALQSSSAPHTIEAKLARIQIELLLDIRDAVVYGASSQHALITALAGGAPERRNGLVTAADLLR
jgi:hypothetical protein